MEVSVNCFKHGHVKPECSACMNEVIKESRAKDETIRQLREENARLKHGIVLTGAEVAEILDLTAGKEE